jgi:hypothetical protein
LKEAGLTRLKARDGYASAAEAAERNSVYKPMASPRAEPMITPTVRSCKTGLTKLLTDVRLAARASESMVQISYCEFEKTDVEVIAGRVRGYKSPDAKHLSRHYQLSLIGNRNQRHVMLSDTA